MIDWYFRQNFEDLFRLTAQFQDEKSVRKETVDKLRASDLEAIGQSFMRSYKSKVEGIFKDIKTNIGNATLAEFKSKKSQTRKDLFTRVTRQLMLHFTCFVEIVSTGQFESQWLQGLLANTT